ncbi:MAG: hypothetical protein K6F50_00740 [Kiritimatiellae bacterium]|nr:hypothetical protein [Kiritimatiellia bacterium]
MAELTDHEWYELVKAGEDAGWKLVWERVVEPESTAMRSAELMKRYSITAGDLMGMLYDEMIGRRKIDLYRDDGGSLQGWLRRYVRGFILNADPNKHGEISIDGVHPDAENGHMGLEVPVDDIKMTRNEVWNMTHLCFRDLWNNDPERALVLLLKTRFHLSSEEVRDFLDVSSVANVDQIFSRSVKFMRNAWGERDRKGF